MFINNWVSTHRDDIKKYWKNYDKDFNTAVNKMCWEDLLNSLARTTH